MIQAWRRCGQEWDKRVSREEKGWDNARLEWEKKKGQARDGSRRLIQDSFTGLLCVSLLLVSFISLSLGHVSWPEYRSLVEVSVRGSPRLIQDSFNSRIVVLFAYVKSLACVSFTCLIYRSLLTLSSWITVFFPFVRFLVCVSSIGPSYTSFVSVYSRYRVHTSLRQIQVSFDNNFPDHGDLGERHDV